jgi:hypothetical protein
MTTEELTDLAKKIKEGNATKEETFKFHEELNKLLSETKGLLEE